MTQNPTLSEREALDAEIFAILKATYPGAAAQNAQALSCIRNLLSGQTPVALAEPVAWLMRDTKDMREVFFREDWARKAATEPGDTVTPLYATPAQPSTVTAEGWKLVPVEPTPELLHSMAVRYDHGLGVPGYYDRPIFGGDGIGHARRLEATITTMRQLHEEVVGTGFYKPSAAAAASVTGALDKPFCWSPGQPLNIIRTEEPGHWSLDWPAGHVVYFAGWNWDVRKKRPDVWVSERWPPQTPGDITSDFDPVDLQVAAQKAEG